jgi:hypothetical protein
MCLSSHTGSTSDMALRLRFEQSGKMMSERS